MTTRKELCDLVADLDGRMPQLVRDNPDDGDFWPAFAGEADHVQDAAGADDYDWVQQQLDELLVKHGKTVPRDAPPPDG